MTIFPTTTSTSYLLKILLSIAVTLFITFAFSAGCRADVDEQGQEEKTVSKKRIEVAFVLDTTGSMTHLIDGAKKKIWSIANSIVDRNPDAEIYFGLVGYRDIGDEYVTKDFPLTTDIQGIYGHLLAFQAAGGGDTPESVNEALDTAISKLEWSDKNQLKASRILFLVGDAPPHMDYKQDRKYPEVIKEAVQKGIIVNAVQAGSAMQTKKVWMEIAALGKGEYLSIPQDGGRAVEIETPYDIEIRRIQGELNSTIIIYGSPAKQEETARKARMYSAAAPSAAAEMSKYVNKSGKGKEVVTGGGDLVADVKSGKKLSEVPETSLPADLRKVPKKDLEKVIEEKSRKREILAEELAEKVARRDAYIKEQKEKTGRKTVPDSFDSSVEKTLSKQIK